MISDPYTQLAHNLHALGMGYPLKDDLVDIPAMPCDSNGVPMSPRQPPLLNCMGVFWRKSGSL
jgi:hypothetical protein